MDLEKYSMKRLASYGLPIYIFGALKKSIPQVLNYLAELQLKCDAVFVKESLPQSIEYSNELSICQGLGIKVVSPTPIASLLPNGVVICAAEQYERKKWIDFFSVEDKHIVVDVRDLFAHTSYEKCQKYFTDSENLLLHCRNCPASYRNCPIRERDYEERGRSRKKAVEQLLLRCGFICNYNCEGCSQFLPYYTARHKIDFNGNEIIRDLNKVAESLQYINELWLEGGESMLWKPLPELLDQAVRLDNVGSIGILTNGSYVPPKEVLDVISENRERIIVHVNAYEANKDLPMLFSVLSRYRIKYYLRDSNKGWVDFKNTSFKRRGVDELRDIRKICRFFKKNYDQWILTDGKLSTYCCEAGYLAHYLDKYDELSNDYIDIREMPEIDLPEAMERLYSRNHLDACNYCAGPFNGDQRIDIAKQFK